MKGLKLVLSVYAFVLAGVLIAAFVWAVPAFAQSQRDSCQFIEAGIDQLSGQSNPDVKPMTAEMCVTAVDSSGAKLIRGFVATVASMVISGFLTAIVLGVLSLAVSTPSKNSSE